MIREQSQMLNCENFLKVTTGLQKKENSKHKGRGTITWTGKGIRMDLYLIGFQVHLTVNDRKQHFMLSSHSNICSLNTLKKFILHIVNFHSRTECDKQYPIQSFIQNWVCNTQYKVLSGSKVPYKSTMCFMMLGHRM